MAFFIGRDREARRTYGFDEIAPSIKTGGKLYQKARSIGSEG